MEVQDQTGQAAGAAEQTQTQAPEPSQQQAQTTDLDSLSKWSYQGKEYTNDDFHKILSGYESLSKESDAYKKEKEFSENLEIDLMNVLERPDLASRFKATYPKKYHAVLDKFLERNGQVTPQNNTAQQPVQLPKEFTTQFDQMKQRLDFHEKRAYDAEVASANAKLDAVLPPLFKKFELASEDQVYAKAEVLLQRGQQVTEKTWERLVRESHESMQKKSDQYYKAKLKSQIETGQRGADGGPGGATPGQAPRKIRTFDEAREAAIAEMTRQRNG